VASLAPVTEIDLHDRPVLSAPTAVGGDLPEELVRGAHPRSVLSAAGVTAAELRSPLWVPTARGLWGWSAVEPTDPLERARRAGALVGGRGAVGGWAAAFLHGATDLDGLHADGTAEPVLLCLRPDQRCRRLTDVTVLRSRLDPDDVTVLDGVPVTSLTRTCADLARLARSRRTAPRRSRPPDLRPGALQDAVVAVDALRRATGVDLEEVLAYLNARHRWRGVRRAKAVLELSEPNTRSPAETRFRMLWVGEAGLPRPRVNQPIRVLGGRVLAEADLLDAGSGLVGEYDGDVHAAAERRSRDLFRAEELRQLNLQVVRVTAVDLTTHRERTVHRLQEAYAAGLRRDRSRDRWRLG
jgi:hypothetical protein